LLKIATLKPGDVVFVSVASGAVGSVACQIAKLKGHTVIGSAGGAAKVCLSQATSVRPRHRLQGYGDLTEALLHVAPTGIDVYFENAGGEHLEAALAAANPFCSLCDLRNDLTIQCHRAARRTNVTSCRHGQELRLEGFNIANYFDLTPEFQREMSRWINEGKITWKETIGAGIENAPTAFLKLFKGENFGKMLVKLR